MGAASVCACTLWAGRDFWGGENAGRNRLNLGVLPWCAWFASIVLQTVPCQCSREARGLCGEDSGIFASGGPVAPSQSVLTHCRAVRWVWTFSVRSWSELRACREHITTSRFRDERPLALFSPARPGQYAENAGRERGAASSNWAPVRVFDPTATPCRASGASLLSHHLRHL